MSKYWRTVITVEVLSEGANPPDFKNLAQVHHAITQGDCSGYFRDEHQEVPEEVMRELLMEHGSDPSFLINEKE